MNKKSLHDKFYKNNYKLPLYANGSLLKDSGYLYDSLPQYGLGSWMKENAGTIGTVAGVGLGALGSVIAPGVGTAAGLALGTSIGSSIGGAVGNSVQKNYVDGQTEIATDRQNDITNATNNYNAQQFKNPMYGTNFATGGDIGNVINRNPVQESTKRLDGITEYKNGGTHEANTNGGIPIGNKGRVEEGEVRVGKYIFSNRF